LGISQISERKMDRLDAMTVFVAAVEQGSLSAAARKLNMPLATVSRKVSELEQHLKTRLVHRTNRQLSLTDSGQAYLGACRRILEEIDEAERIATGEYAAPRGALVVTAPIVFGRIHLLPIVASFLEAFPDVDVRLALADRVSNLLEEHIDVALRVGHLPDSSLYAAKIGTIRRVVCASPDYLERHGTPLEPAELAGQACITFEGQSNANAWTFGEGRSQIIVPIHSRLVTTTAEASIDAARLGLGITRVFSYQVAHALANGEISIVLSDFEPPPIPINLVYAGGGLLALKLRAFLDHVTPRLRKRLEELPGAIH
jgi:DNA-binding transcriptional LysR family regulator